MTDQEREQELSNCTAAGLGEVLTNAGFALGEAAGIETAIKYVQERAGALFVKGEDEFAKAYRQLADELKGLEKKQRARYDADEQPWFSVAFRLLDNFVKKEEGNNARHKD